VVGCALSNAGAGTGGWLDRPTAHSSKKWAEAVQCSAAKYDGEMPFHLLLVKKCISLLIHAMLSASAVLQRWAVYSAATMLTKYKKEYQALQTAMQQRASIDKCVAAIEQSWLCKTSN